MAVVVLVDRHHVGDRLAPRQLVGVVLEGADEDDRSLGRRDGLEQVVPIVEVGRQPQVEHVDERLMAVVEPEPQKITACSSVAPTAARMMSRASSRKREVWRPGARRLGVGVGVQRQHRVADVVLDEGQRPAGRGVVGVGDPARPERAGHRLVVADDGGTDGVDERLGRVGDRCRHGRPACRASRLSS